MKCPRCKFVSNETADACPKCKFDLARYRSLLGLGVVDGRGVDGHGVKSGQEQGGAYSQVAAPSGTMATKGGAHSEDDWFTRFFGSSKGGAESAEPLPTAVVNTDHTPQGSSAEVERCSDESGDDLSITDKLGELFKEEKDASSKLPNKADKSSHHCPEVHGVKEAEGVSNGMPTVNMLQSNVNAGNMNAGNMNAGNMNAGNMNAGNVNSEVHQTSDERDFLDGVGDFLEELNSPFLEGNGENRPETSLDISPEKIGASAYDSASTEHFFNSLLEASTEKLGVDIADLAGLGKLDRHEILTEIEDSSGELSSLEAELERELDLLSSEGTNLRVENAKVEEQGFVATSQLEELERELERDLQDMLAGGEEREVVQSAGEIEQEPTIEKTLEEPLLSKDIEAELDAELKSLESEGFKFLSVENADGESQNAVAEDSNSSEVDESSVIEDTVGDTFAELGDILAELAMLEQEDKAESDMEPSSTEQNSTEQNSTEQGGHEQSELGFLDGLSENELEADGLSSAELQIIADRIANAGKARLLDAMRAFEEEIKEETQEGLGTPEQEGGASDCDAYSSLEDVLAELEQETVSDVEDEDLTAEKLVNDNADSARVNGNDQLTETLSGSVATSRERHPDAQSDTRPNTQPSTPCITQGQSPLSGADVVTSSLLVVNAGATDATTDAGGSTLVDNLWENLSVELESPNMRNEHRDFAFTDLAITHLGSVSQNPNTDLYFSELEDELLMGGRAGKARVREQFLRARDASASYSAELHDESMNSAMQEALREVEQQECVVDDEPTFGGDARTDFGRERRRDQIDARLSRGGDSKTARIAANRSGGSADRLLEESGTYATAEVAEHSCPRVLRLLCAQTIDVLLFLGLSLVLEVVFSVPKEMRDAIFKISFQSLWVCDMLPHVADALVRFTFLYMVCNTWLVFSSGQTVGQRLFGLMTCDSSGDVPAFSQAFVSSAAVSAYLLTCGLGALPIFGAQRQMLGRYLSHTEIVDR